MDKHKPYTKYIQRFLGLHYGVRKLHKTSTCPIIGYSDTIKCKNNIISLQNLVSFRNWVNFTHKHPRHSSVHSKVLSELLIFHCLARQTQRTESHILTTLFNAGYEMLYHRHRNYVTAKEKSQISKRTTKEPSIYWLASCCLYFNEFWLIKPYLSKQTK